MVGLLIAFPGLVSTPDSATKVDPASIQLEAPPAADLESAAADQDKKNAEQDQAEGKDGKQKEEEEDDPAKALQLSLIHI